MTDKTDMRKLIEAVEAGTWTVETHPIHETPNFTEFHNAYYGSLDAAKALHEALLPGWEYGVTYNHEEPDCAAFVAEWGSNEETDGYVGDAICPARAWLIAILKAYEAQL